MISVQKCLGCRETAEDGVIHVIEDDGRKRICLDCMRREGLLIEDRSAPVGIAYTDALPEPQDRDFGSGVPGMIARACYELRDLLIMKNRKYGNSALEPIRVFSRADSVEQIRVRLDDKLARIRQGESDEDEDVELDLSGYLILLKVARWLRAGVKSS